MTPSQYRAGGANELATPMAALLGDRTEGDRQAAIKVIVTFPEPS